jgi:outer membrane protein assembly factor BamB
MSWRRVATIGGLALLVGLATWLCRKPHRPVLSPEQRAAAADTGRSSPFLPAGTEDRGWPFVRGPHFDGHSPEIHLADRWPDTGPPVLWHRTLGQGYSSFVAREDRVFTQYQTLSGQYVVCLAAETGEIIWEHHYDWPFEAAGLYPGPRATPTIDGNRIFFASPAGLVGCLSWEGGLIWQVNVHDKFLGKGTEFGFASSPTVVDGLLLIPVGGPGASLVALDAKDGTTRWQSGNDPASYVPAYPVAVQGRKLVFVYLQNALACFDQEDGRQIWRMDLSTGYDEHAAWPICVDGKLWISAPFKFGSRLFDVADCPPLPPIVWQSQLLSNDVYSSVYDQDALFGFDLRDVQAKLHRSSRGVFRCLDFATGDRLWETTETGHCSVLVADGKLFLFNDQGELIVARATRERYAELARCTVLPGEIGWTGPALDRGRLFVRNQKFAACVYLGDPALFHTTGNTKPITVAEIPKRRYYDLAVIMGVEPEYAMDSPSVQWLKTWFVVGLALLVAATALGAFVRTAWDLVWGSKPRLELSGPLIRTIAMVLGCGAMTPLSYWRGEFVFTWPVALFAAFDAAVCQVRLSRGATGEIRASWRERIVVCVFLVVCLVYFVLCRRLSLAFEWVFLAGFPAALPWLLLSRWLETRVRRPAVLAILLAGLAYSSFFWSSVAMLWWKYPPTE